jgi:CDGSH-type Zn-finger protein
MEEEFVYEVMPLSHTKENDSFKSVGDIDFLEGETKVELIKSRQPSLKGNGGGGGGRAMSRSYSMGDMYTRENKVESTGVCRCGASRPRIYADSYDNLKFRSSDGSEEEEAKEEAAVPETNDATIVYPQVKYSAKQAYDFSGCEPEGPPPAITRIMMVDTHSSATCVIS